MGAMEEQAKKAYRSFGKSSFKSFDAYLKFAWKLRRTSKLAYFAKYKTMSFDAFKAHVANSEGSW